MTESLYPKHACGPVPEVTPPIDTNAIWAEFLRVAHYDSRGLVSNSDWVKFLFRRLQEMAP